MQSQTVQDTTQDMTQDMAHYMAPPEFLQLAGHPLRWRLLSELAASDRTVNELTGLVDGAQNLVSYHLGKLRDAGLVTTRRSSFDGRDAYYAADLRRIGALLSSTAGALHPGLAITAPPAFAERPPRASVLFLCTGNSSRSQIAEALARERSCGAVHAFSAGSHPKPVHPNAVRVLRDEHGIDISAQKSKHLGVFAKRRFDRVITLCDRVREICPEFPGSPKTIHWSIPDPGAGGGDDEISYPAFQQTAAELEIRVGFLLAVISNSASAPRQGRGGGR